jgi:type II restriction enzyme
MDRFPNNSPVADFYCSSCSEEYELKSKKGKLGSQIQDGAFKKKCERLAASNNPNLFVLSYDLTNLTVTNLLIVPKHFFIRDIIQERKPLSTTARRAGWIGSNILLGKIPDSGKIHIVKNGILQPKGLVFSEWKKTLFLREETLDARGWLIEVMKCVEDIGKQEFDLDDVYSYENKLRQLYPHNQHVKQKIRQQLQVLRDQGYLDFVSRGSYRLRSQTKVQGK